MNHPRVFTAEVVGRLQALNECVRWLRENGFSSLAVDFIDKRPRVVVDRRASHFLLHVGRGCSARLQPDGHRLCSIVKGHCEIFWEDRIEPAAL